MKELPKRKPNRLQGYDYSSAGFYFVTICVKNSYELFGEVVGGKVQLNEYGVIVDDAVNKINEIYDCVRTDKYVVMPNHVHMIVVIDVAGSDGRQVAAPTLSSVVGNMKREVSMRVGFSVWQKSFHDRIIRSKEEYWKIYNYIENNPATWEKDCFYNVGE